jgi:hypothetical protein
MKHLVIEKRATLGTNPNKPDEKPSLDIYQVKLEPVHPEDPKKYGGQQSYLAVDKATWNSLEIGEAYQFQPILK